MNEHISKIAEDSFYTLPPGSLSEARAHVFADNIIKECCKMINVHMQHNNPNDSLLVLKIKEHFGIKKNE